MSLAIRLTHNENGSYCCYLYKGIELARTTTLPAVRQGDSAIRLDLGSKAGRMRAIHRVINLISYVEARDVVELAILSFESLIAENQCIEISHATCVLAAEHGLATQRLVRDAVQF